MERDLLLEDLRTLYRGIEQISISEIPKTDNTIEKMVEIPETTKTDNPAKESRQTAEPEAPLITKDPSTHPKDLNQFFTGQNSEDLNQHFKSKEPNDKRSPRQQPIGNLIDLNTRIFLKNELCQNREDVLTHLLQQLEEMPDLATALDYIHDEWSNGHSAEAVDRLRSLVKQQFGLDAE